MFISILYLYFLEKFLSGAVFITQVCLWPSVHILSCTYLYLHCKGGLVCFGSAAFRKNKGPVDAEPEMESYQLVLDESLLWTNAVHKTCFCYIVQGLTKKVVFFYNPLSFLLPSPPSFHHEHVQSSWWCCWMCQKAEQEVWDSYAMLWVAFWLYEMSEASRLSLIALCVFFLTLIQFYLLIWDLVIPEREAGVIQESGAPLLSCNTSVLFTWSLSLLAVVLQV